MSIAQQLYEGVDIAGEGTVGLITYMRTDSLRISDDAQREAAAYIKEHYGEAYCPKKFRQYRANANAQDAHEAIRPSNVALSPDKVRHDLTNEQYQLYRLIWGRFLSSQMENAVYDVTSVEVESGVHNFRASDSKPKFPGYTAVYEESRDEEKEEKEPTLPILQDGENVKLADFAPAQHFTQPPAHYTEATLIRALEEQGIGRPSTYAPTVTTILDRSYVKKDGKYLVVTNLGRAVTQWMENYFANIADLKFTAKMEKELDSVEEGKTPWKEVLRGFYGGFEEKVSQAQEGERVRVEPTVSEEKCPICGRNLVERESKFGAFLGCPGYPECTFTMPLVVVMPGRCPKCGGRLMKRTGTSKKTGKQFNYYCCEYTGGRVEGHDCDFMTWDVPTKDDCPKCGQTMFKRAGRGYNRPFCINESCENFLPEEKRGYIRKTAKTEEPESVAEKETAKKPVTRKAAAKTATRSAEKTAAKKTATKKTAAKKKETK